MSVQPSQYIHYLKSASNESIPDAITPETKKTDRFSQLSSQDSFLPAIQAVRCLAVIGFIGSLFASVLVPASICGVIAFASCVLYNKMKPKDSQNLEGTPQVVQQVAHRNLSRSPSIASSVISNASNTSSVSSNSWLRTLTRKPSVLSKIPEQKVSFKEALLGSIEDRVGGIKEQCCDLLAICYFSLFQKQDDLPKHLHEALMKKSNPEYLKEKVKKYVGEGTGELKLTKEKVEGGKNYILEGIPSTQQSFLQEAKPSAIMETIADLYEKIDKKDDVEKARKLTQKLLDHEELQEMHFAGQIA